ncbi:hypothetical protein OESDEN_16130 [Oesophagostomum dentatum]|uniref:Uncharacterized protein n=1 Tax=Oesophagostomum dentatum TaxID=61180 RepID=A0A0B1SLW7_OESDE|nr:hypothetical protein OESDEN_16130 [Oesophagostomum dentatum]
MAALGFGKNRHKTNAEPAERVPRSSVDHEVSRTEHVTTVGDYLRTVNTVNTLPTPHIKQEEVVPLQSLIPPERKPPVVDPPKPVVPVHRVVSAAASPSAAMSPKDNCRDVKFLQKKAYEAQIAREEAMTKYYLLKMKKLELEIEQLQRNKT